MVIAALVVFGALVAAWFVAPAERAAAERSHVDASVEPRQPDLPAPLGEGLVEAA